MKYKVIFDSNFLWHDKESNLGELFNFNLSEINAFIEDNNLKSQVEIFIPEIVFEERLNQIKSLILSMVKNIELGFKQLEVFRVKKPSAQYRKKNYEKFLIGNTRKLLKKNSISIIRIPKINQNLLISRSVRYVPPFKRSKRGDAGFKDTILWLSLLNHSRKNRGDAYILCSDDDVFLDPAMASELSKVSGCKLITIPNAANLKEYLDKEFTLKLELKERNQAIANEITKNLGELMIQVHKRLKPESDPYPFSVINSRRSAIGLFREPEVPLGYDFIDLSFQDINEDRKDVFSVNLKLTVKPRNFENEGSNSSIVWHPSISDKIMDVKLEYSNSTKKFKVISIVDGTGYGLMNRYYYGSSGDNSLRDRS